MPIIYKSRLPTHINHAMSNGSQQEKGVHTPKKGGVQSPIAEMVFNKKWKNEIMQIARATAAAAKVAVACGGGSVAAAVDVAATATVTVAVAAAAPATVDVAVACGGATVAATVAAGKAAAVAASKAADRKAMVAAADMALACRPMTGWSVSGGDECGFDIRDALLMDRFVSSSLPCWASAAIDCITEAARQLNVSLKHTGIVVDASNQMAMTLAFMGMREFTSMFEHAVVVAAQTTYATSLGKRFDNIMCVVPDGCAVQGEKRGVNEDPIVARWINELTRLGKSALVLSGDGKMLPGDDDIYQGVLTHLQAGLPLIILAKDGTCSGNYDALQEMYPDLLRVIRCVIPE